MTKSDLNSMSAIVDNANSCNIVNRVEVARYSAAGTATNTADRVAIG